LTNKMLDMLYLSSNSELKQTMTDLLHRDTKLYLLKRKHTREIQSISNVYFKLLADQIITTSTNYGRKTAYVDNQGYRQSLIQFSNPKKIRKMLAQCDIKNFVSAAISLKAERHQIVHPDITNLLASCADAAKFIPTMDNSQFHVQIVKNYKHFIGPIAT
jgi:Holliday junction resolvase RusA-like endonuclease